MDPPFDLTFMAEAGVAFDEGLSDIEIEHVQANYEFEFPPDLRSLLQFALPIGDNFVDWRNGPEQSIRERLDWPKQGICFDIEHNDFWLEEWGTKPLSLDDAFEIARTQVSAAPTLIPIFSHRYIPDRPNEAGNPVFSVYQTDIIYYWIDLEDYLRRELNKKGAVLEVHAVKRIEYWTYLVELSQ